MKTYLVKFKSFFRYNRKNEYNTQLTEEHFKETIEELDYKIVMQSEPVNR